MSLQTHPVRAVAFVAATVLLAALAWGAAVATGQKIERSLTPVTETAYYHAADTMAPDGSSIRRDIIAGPPHPPEGAPLRATLTELPTPEPSAGINTISGVPVYSWSYGCSATSAAMIAGYYDRSGYPNMYTGPTAGGVMPLNNDTYWATSVDSCGQTRSNCPLSATKNGLDGRSSRGHVDDYWICYGNSGPDPFVTNGWTEHTAGACTGDYMGTNQASSPINNSDGATTFWHYSSGAKLTADHIRSWGSTYTQSSGLCGIQEFYESRGYTVVEAYNQFIYPYGGNTQGFTYQQFQTEIDNGRPVMFHVQGHTMVGVGYNTNTNLIYLHDTWDHSVHTMTWGGSYSGMTMYAVSVVVLEGSPSPQTGNAALPGIGLLLLGG